MDRFLHACTPARYAPTLTLLGNVPAGSLPNTLVALTLNALAPISSLIVEGVSVFLAHSSKLLDLSSPRAKRPTIRPARALSALCSYPSTKLNSRLSINLINLSSSPIKLVNQSSKMALQASLEPVNENGPCREKLVCTIDTLKNLQIWLSVALNGMLCVLVLLYSPTIHNLQLCVVLQESWPITHPELTVQYCPRTQQNHNPSIAISSTLPHRDNVTPTFMLSVGRLATPAKIRQGAEQLTGSLLNTSALLSGLAVLASLDAPLVNRASSNTLALL
jgi:hypothetical protein